MADVQVTKGDLILNKTQKILAGIVLIVGVMVFAFVSLSPDRTPYNNFQQTEDDQNVTSRIRDSYMIEGDLYIEFYHEGPGQQPVTIVGRDDYELEKEFIGPFETNRLIVRDFDHKEFDLHVGPTSDVFTFGDSKFDYLQFRSDLYENRNCDIQECRICFDFNKTREFSESAYEFKTHITNLQQDSNRWHDVSNVHLENYVTRESMGTVIELRNVSVEHSYTCEYDFNFTTTPVRYAWCYSSDVNGTTVQFEHRFDRGNIPSKTIWWNETVEREVGVPGLVNKSTFRTVTRSQVKNAIQNADIGDTGTICIAGNVQAGEIVDVWPEAFDNTYEEYATWEAAEWLYHKNLTILNSSLTLSDGNLPVPFHFFDEDLRDSGKVRPDGHDIAVVSNESVQLPHTMEFNQTYNSTHAEIVLTVFVPAVASTADTTVQLWYGNDDIVGSEENESGVWNNTDGALTYFAVYTFPNVTHPFHDSSGFREDATCKNAANCPVWNTSNSGVVGKGVYIQSTNNDGLFVMQADGSQLGEAFWTCAWAAPMAPADNAVVQGGTTSLGSPYYQWINQYVSNRFRWDATANTLNSGANPPEDGTFLHTCVVLDGTGDLDAVYLNGDNIGSSTAGSSDFSSVNHSTIGWLHHSNDNGLGHFNGTVDQVYWGTGSLTDSLYTVMYQLEGNASGHFTIGPEQGAAAGDDCGCPDPIADWQIDDGSNCILDTACYMPENEFRLLSGTLIIRGSGKLTAQCSDIREQGTATLVVENGDGLVCV